MRVRVFIIAADTCALIIATAYSLLYFRSRTDNPAARLGGFLNAGFDQIYNIMNPLVQAKGDIFDTYIVRVGLHQGRYSHTTAVGLFKSVIGFILIMGSNQLAQRLSGGGFFK